MRRKTNNQKNCRKIIGIQQKYKNTEQFMKK